MTVKARVFRQHERVADRYVSDREAVRTQIRRVLKRDLNRLQAANEPFGIGIDDIGLAPLQRLQLAVAKHERLRDRQRRIGEVLPVQESTVGRLICGYRER